MGRRLLSLALLAAGAAGLAGCGSTAHQTLTITRTLPAAPPSTTGSSSASAATHARRAAAPRASALAGRSPRAIIDLSAGALRRSGGYAMRADLRQAGRRTIIDLTTTGARTFDATLTIGGAVSDVIGVSGAAYLRGNLAFWRAQSGGTSAARSRARSRALADRWLRVPAAGAHSVIGSLGTLAPGTFARCLTEDHGTLSVVGRTRIGRARAIVVRDAGNAPGATPSTIAVAATGAPYPLRYIATGPSRTGGPVDVCNTGRGGGAEGTITLSQFGRIAAIQPPIAPGQAPGGSQA